jgi:plastocyanin
MQVARLAIVLCGAVLTCCSRDIGAMPPLHAAEVHAQLVPLTPLKLARSAVIWLEPVDGSSVRTVEPGKFTLLQKNKTFVPHLLVVPVGSSVSFPNKDPFFHNVFSLFDGKRFDLGLYEAGSTRSVIFSRLGVSYIFCNIHSGMSAVVIALDTPFFSIADQEGEFRLSRVPDGEYDLHVWAEGEPQSTLDKLTKRINISGAEADLGEIHAGKSKQEHMNKFGRPYEPDSVPPY